MSKGLLDYELEFNKKIIRLVADEISKRGFPKIGTILKESLDAIINHNEARMPDGEYYIPVEIKEGCELPKKEGGIMAIGVDPNTLGLWYHLEKGIDNFRSEDGEFQFTHWLKKIVHPVLNSDKNPQVCDATESQSKDETLAQNNSLSQIDWEGLEKEFTSNWPFEAIDKKNFGNIFSWLKTNLPNYIK